MSENTGVADAYRDREGHGRVKARPNGTTYEDPTTTQPDDLAEETEIEECDPEFIDGSYYGCGACGPCVQDEIDRQQLNYEMGIEDE